MDYIKNDSVFKVDDWVYTSRTVSSTYSGHFEKGTRVRIIGISERGYDLADEHGKRVIDTGFDSVCKE